MKKIQILFFLIVFLLTNESKAQCVTGTPAGDLVPSSSMQFANNVNGGTYYNFSAVAGNIYTFSFCSADGGSSNYDTQITLLNPAGNIVMTADDDHCGTNARLDFSCTISANYKVLVTKYNCNAQPNMGKLAYNMQSLPVCPSGLGQGTIHVASLPYSSGPGTTAGSVNDLNWLNIRVCDNASYLSGEDKVWIFSPVTGGNVTIALATTNTRAGISLYKGCPLNGNSSTCIASDLGAGNLSITTCLEQGEVYYLIADSKSPSNNFTYSGLTISAPVAVSACNLGDVVMVGSLPYSSAGRSTCGKGNDINSSPVGPCGNTAYLRNEEEVFSFTPAVSGNVNISISSSAAYTGLFLYQGCPLNSYCSSSANKCLANVTSASGSKSLCAYVTAGKTYYAIVDGYNSCFSYSINISSPVSDLNGSTCANAVVINSLPYSAQKENTSCMGDDYNNFTPGTFGSLYESGEDKVYSYTSKSAECIGITLSSSNTNSIGYEVYNGVPGTFGVTCIANAGGASSGTLNGSATLPAAGTYYIIVDTWADPSTAQYNISVKSFGASAINDLPCRAIMLSAGINVTGDNSCSSGLSEPAQPSCWSSQNILNTVWYSFVAPSSGKAIIKTSAGSIRNTQIAAYSGSCKTDLTFISCNDDASSCGATKTSASQLELTGLTAGATYYIVVDGVGSLTGTFGIMMMDATAGIAAVPGQDCSSPLRACSNMVSVGDPGFQSFGNTCDFTGGSSNCILSGERGSVWYELPIKSNGFLEFTIIPNDWKGASSMECTDYDFVIWKMTDDGLTCKSIGSGLAPVRCNYSYLGITGLYGNFNGMENPSYAGFGIANQSKLPVSAGEKYLLVISNYSNSVSGFRLEISNNSPVEYTNASETVQWTGGIDSDWFKADNWGGCNIPSCGTNAVITPSSENQPVINGNGAAVKSITISGGASLTISNSNSLSVCGNIVNNGIFSANENSTVTLTGSADQTITGSLTANNAFANLVIAKSAGKAKIENDFEIKGDLSINSSNTLEFTANKITLTGNLSNSNGSLVLSQNATMQFNGTASQNYLNNGTLCNVTVNNSDKGISLLSNMILSKTSKLDLQKGKIITTPNYEVNLQNSSAAAISAGKTNSFIQGNLRRALPEVQTMQSIDFPVGNNAKGYQRMNMSFYNGADPSIGSLKVCFNSFLSNIPVATGTDPTCSVNYNGNAMNNGYWSVIPQGNGTADMNLTLFAANASNAASTVTVMRNSGSNTWSIPVIKSGSCVTANSKIVLRNGIQQNYSAGVAVNFAVAQSGTSAPMDFLSFIAEPGNKAINTTWVTSGESNNKGFEVQRATKNGEYEVVGWVDANGNATTLNSYTLEDKNVLTNTIYYYRLRQVSTEGKETFSRTVAAIIREKGVIVCDVYPNPYRENTVIKYILSRPSMITIEVNDMSGRLIKKYQQGLQDAGTYSLPFSAKASGFTSGTYTVSIWCDDQRSQVRITETD